MMTMSAALDECAVALENDGIRELSLDERAAYERLVEICRNVVEFADATDADAEFAADSEVKG